jgi:hypothetical protein
MWVAKTGKVTWHAWATIRGEHIRLSGNLETNGINVWKQRDGYASKT